MVVKSSKELGLGLDAPVLPWVWAAKVLTTSSPVVEAVNETIFLSHGIRIDIKF